MGNVDPKENGFQLHANSCPLWVKSDMCAAQGHVCFTPESGHVRRNYGCPLWANSGHRNAAFRAWAWASAAAYGMSTAIRLIRPFCCARAKCGHATVDPTIALMKSRRRMLLPFEASTPFLILA